MRFRGPCRSCSDVTVISKATPLRKGSLPTFSRVIRASHPAARGACAAAFCKEICESSPLPDVVTASIGPGEPFSAVYAPCRCATAAINGAEAGPRLLAPVAAEL